MNENIKRHGVSYCKNSNTHKSLPAKIIKENIYGRSPGSRAVSGRLPMAPKGAKVT